MTKIEPRPEVQARAADSLNYLKPMISKFERLQSQLSDAEAALAAAYRTRYSIAGILLPS